WWGREKMKDLRKWAKDRMEARFSDTFFNLTILHAGVLPPPLLKRELEIRIVDELRRPPDEHHKKDDKKHHPPAAAGKGAKPEKPAPKAAAKPVPAKAKPQPKKKAAAKKKPAPKKSRPAA